MENFPATVFRRAVSAVVVTVVVGAGLMVTASPPASSSPRASVAIEMPNAIDAGAAVHARVVVRDAESVAGAQFTLAYDRHGLAFDGAQAPAGRVGLNTVEHVEGLTGGFYSAPGASKSAELVTDVVLAPRSLGTFAIELRDVVLVDRNGRVIPASVTSESSITIGASRKQHAAPRQVRANAFRGKPARSQGF